MIVLGYTIVVMVPAFSLALVFCSRVDNATTRSINCNIFKICGSMKSVERHRCKRTDQVLYTKRKCMDCGRTKEHYNRLALRMGAPISKYHAN